MPDLDEKKTGEPTAADDKAPKFDGEFDADRAARLIARLREEIADLKNDLGTARSALQERDDAEKTETQRLADRLKAAEEEAAKARRSLLVERATRKHNLPDDVVEFLTGDTEEEIEAKAERLAALSGGKRQEPEQPSQDEEHGIPARPEPSLRPGHGGEPPVSIDPVAVARAARAAR